MFVSRLVFAAAIVALNAVPIPDEPLTKAFVSTTGWTGGDAAYSVPLSKKRSLWLFGDTFIGRIDRGVRKSMDMVHNTAGWLDVSSNGSMRFKYFWKVNARREPVSLLEPKQSTAYYWPSGMAVSGGKLALFCKVVVNKPQKGADDGFGFDWTSSELVLVDNAKDEPTRWQYRRVGLPGGEANLMPGAALLTEEKWTYVYCTENTGGSHVCSVMRVPSAELFAGNFSNAAYFSEDGSWQSEPLHVAHLFPSAPEMSVSRVDGLPGFFCVYSENGLSPNIMLRHADKPEGPWSEPVLLYRAPEPLRDKSLLCYGAKHHPELAREPRTLVITYCLNPGGAAAHRTAPMAYFPKAVTVSLKDIVFAQ